MNLRFLLNEKDETNSPSTEKKRKMDSPHSHPTFVQPKEAKVASGIPDSFIKFEKKLESSSYQSQPILINLVSMSKSESELLAKFIQENSQQTSNYFARNKVFYCLGVAFALSHGLITRPCGSDESACHIEIIDQETVLGKGSFGRIYASKGTISIIDEKAVFTPETTHAIKEEYHQNEQHPERKNEFQYSPIHLHLKKPVIFFITPQCAVSFTIMDRIPGHTLLDVIHKSIIDLDVDKLLELCINLTDALQLQVHDYGIIHRDLKLENIMIYQMMVTIIDFGLCKKSGTTDEDECVGTNGYIPPEASAPETSGAAASENMSTEARDIYALGSIFFLLCGGCLDQIEEHPFSKQKNETLVIPGFPDIPATHHMTLQNLINTMRHANPTLRPTTEDISFTLNKIRLERKLTTLSTDIHSEVESAFTEANNLKTKELNKLAKMNIAIDNLKQIDLLAATFFQAISALKGTSFQIKEFVEALNIKALHGITNREELNYTLGTTVDRFKNYLVQLSELQFQAKKFGPKNCLLMKIENTLQKIGKYKLTFANISMLNNKVGIKLSKLKQLFEESDKKSHQSLLSTYSKNLSGRKDEFSMSFFPSNDSSVVSNDNNKQEEKRITATR